MVRSRWAAGRRVDIKLTISFKDIRVQLPPEKIDSYIPKKRGIDAIWKPYDLANNIYDVRLMASDKSSEINERLTMDDINKELERFRNFIISDSMKDSPLYVKSFDKQKISMVFETREDNKALDTIDDVRKGAKNMTVESDVPKGAHQIRWQDKSW